MTYKQKAQDLLAKYKDKAIFVVDEILAALTNANAKEYKIDYWLDVRNEMKLP
jgi:L-rhamnose mutarotase